MCTHFGFVLAFVLFSLSASRKGQIFRGAMPKLLEEEVN